MVNNVLQPLPYKEEKEHMSRFSRVMLRIFAVLGVFVVYLMIQAPLQVLLQGKEAVGTVTSTSTVNRSKNCGVIEVIEESGKSVGIRPQSLFPIPIQSGCFFVKEGDAVRVIYVQHRDGTGYSTAYAAPRWAIALNVGVLLFGVIVVIVLYVRHKVKERKAKANENSYPIPPIQ